MTTLKSLKNELRDLRDEFAAYKETQTTINKFYVSEIKRLSGLLEKETAANAVDELTDEELLVKKEREDRLRRYNQYINTLTMGPRPFSARRNDENR